ncbi:MAG: hypothetical protein K2L67_04060 [Clostridia bacterium]|nr:hypothetical protein [Clostridia bacterium]
MNKDGKETEKTQKCMMSLKISGFNPIAAYEHITVYRFKGTKFKEISFNDFCELVKANGFEIHLDYYCDFAKSILLKGDMGKFGIEISLTEVAEINYIFQ